MTGSDHSITHVFNIQVFNLSHCNDIMNSVTKSYRPGTCIYNSTVTNYGEHQIAQNSNFYIMLLEIDMDLNFTQPLHSSTKHVPKY